MKRKMEVSELIFKIIAYVLLIAFALMCVYPFIYAISSSFSSAEAIKNGQVIIIPIDMHIEAYKYVLLDNMFWISYANTLFVALLGTVWCLVYTILGAYALSKKRLMGRHGFNFFLVFTMWFAAGIVPQFLNYQATGDAFAAIAGKSYDAIDQKWLIIIAMGMNATNVILLRNTFEGVPSEIEEAARIDGATEMQVLFNVYLPMSKATIATVALFFGISRWNGYFWSMKMMEKQPYSWPVQVKIKDFIKNYSGLTEIAKGGDKWQNIEGVDYTKVSAISIVYAMVISGIVPILVIYPFIQKYFAKGVNMGGVKE